MNAASTGLENMDLDRLNDKDKADLRQFLANEQQRSQIQSRMFFSLPQCSRNDRGLNSLDGRMANEFNTTETHSLTQICWTKCVTGSIKNGKLDRSEEGCLKNCVDRFLDMNFLTMKHLNNMRS